METLLTIFKALLLIAGIIVLIDIILSLILMPIVNRIKAKRNFAYIQKVAQDILEDLKKEQEKEQIKPKKTTRKPRNTKKNEEN